MKNTLKNTLRKNYRLLLNLTVSVLFILSAIFFSVFCLNGVAFAENGITVYETTSPASELNVNTNAIGSSSSTNNFDEFVNFTQPMFTDADGTYRIVFDRTDDLNGYIYISYETQFGSRIRTKLTLNLLDLLNLPSSDQSQYKWEDVLYDIKVSQNLGAIFILYQYGSYSYIKAYSLSNLQNKVVFKSDIRVILYSLDFINDTLYCYGRGCIISIKFDKTSFEFKESNNYISNINNTGSNQIVGNIAAVLKDSVVKLFIVYDGKVYESTNNILSTNAIENLGEVKNIAISERYFITFTDSLNIYYYSFTDNSLNLTSPTAPDIYSLFISTEEDYNEMNLKSISAFSIDFDTNYIYISDSFYHAVKIYDPATLSYLGMMGSYGTSDYRFRNPSSVAVSKNYIFVSDNENGRIQRISRSDLKEISGITTSVNKPVLVAANKYDQFYVYDSSKTLTKYGYDLKQINGGTISLSDYEITQMVVGPDNALYFYDSVTWKIYRIKDNYTTVEEFCSLPASISKISFALSGSTLYAANAKTIYPIDNNGKIVTERIINIQNYSFVKLNGLMIDYEGNIFVCGEKNGSVINLYKISRNGKTNYSTGKKFVFVSNYLNLNYINSLVADTFSNLCYLVSGASTELSSANTVILINGIISTSNKTYDDFPDDFDNITVAKVTANAEFMTHLSNFEDVKTINEGTYVVVLANTVYGSTEYCYVCIYDENGNAVGFIEKSHLEYKEGASVTDSYKTITPLTGDTITIFKTPIEVQYIETYNNVLFKDVEVSVEVIDDVCNDEGKQIVLGGAKWYKVTYDGKTGYVTKYSVLPFVQEDAVPIKSFAIVKADAIGLTVTLYAQPDEYSAILDLLTDGSKVQLCEKFNKNSQFTKVIIDGMIGYVLTDNLILDGLTTGQIVAIIVTVVVAVIAIIILVITLVLKKKRKDNFL